MRKLFLMISLLPLLSGCYLTQAGAVKDLSMERSARYDSYMLAKKEAVASVVTALKDIDRGGMTVEIGDDGRVASVSYTQPIEIDSLVSMASITPYKEAPVTGLIDELGNFVMKATNLAVPFATIYYSSKNHQATQDASVLINAADNQAQSTMWNSYTGNYQNVTDTSTIDTSTIELREIAEYETTTTDSSNNTTTDTSVLSP